MNFDLSQQELTILIHSLQCLDQQDTQSPDIARSRLYNKLHSRHEYIQRLNRKYTHDA